jgi:hypothetical protein
MKTPSWRQWQQQPQEVLPCKNSSRQQHLMVQATMTSTISSSSCFIKALQQQSSNQQLPLPTQH